MADLINRAALLAEYDKHHVGAPGGARKLIEEAPTIDAVPVDKISFTDLYLANGEAIATFKFGNQGITIYKKCDDVYTEEDVRDAYTGGYSCGMEQGMEKAVVHGRWLTLQTEKDYWGFDADGDFGCYSDYPTVCTECGYDLTEHHGERTNYCPSCGAKMDGEE